MKSIAYLLSVVLLLQDTSSMGASALTLHGEKPVAKIVAPNNKNSSKSELTQMKMASHKGERTLFDLATEVYKDYYNDESLIYKVFDNNFDHETYHRDEIKREMSEVLVEKAETVKKGGRKCKPFDFYAVHFKSWEGKVKVQDSDTHYKGYPMTFQQGHYQVIKCFDMTVFNLFAGQSVGLKCPAHYANGGAEVYGDYDSYRIPANTPLDYELEVLECEGDRATFDEKMKKYKKHRAQTATNTKVSNKQLADAEKNLDKAKTKVGQMKKQVEQAESEAKVAKKESDKASDKLKAGDTSASKAVKADEKGLVEKAVADSKKKAVKKAEKKIDQAEKATSKAQ